MNDEPRGQKKVEECIQCYENARPVSNPESSTSIRASVKQINDVPLARPPGATSTQG